MARIRSDLGQGLLEYRAQLERLKTQAQPFAFHLLHVKQVTHQGD